AQAQLDHPNLVRLSFADKDGETYFLVTEYVPGADLRRLVRFQGRLDARHSAVVVSQAAEALAYVHERGIVHRDVKPGNLLVTPAGHTKLTDLGLARFSSEIDKPGLDRSKHIVGTPDFIAPETIVSPSEVRTVSDVYSLGCTLYYAVTGKVPFPGGATAAKLRRHLEEVPMTPTRFNDGLEEPFVELIGEMMHKDPHSRLPTAAAVLERFRPWTAQAHGATQEELGQFAQAPGDRCLTDAAIADTTPVDADSVESSSTKIPSHAASQDDAYDRITIATYEPRATPRSGKSARSEREQGMGSGLTALLAIAALVALAALATVLLNF
ncbi:MAG: serine/threonine-protein kinase, partial [Planctomycetota bacterium]